MSGDDGDIYEYYFYGIHAHSQRYWSRRTRTSNSRCNRLPVVGGEASDAEASSLSGKGSQPTIALTPSAGISTTTRRSFGPTDAAGEANRIGPSASSLTTNGLMLIVCV